MSARLRAAEWPSHPLRHVDGRYVPRVPQQPQRRSSGGGGSAWTRRPAEVGPVARRERVELRAGGLRRGERTGLPGRPPRPDARADQRGRAPRGSGRARRAPPARRSTNPSTPRSRRAPRRVGVARRWSPRAAPRPPRRPSGSASTASSKVMTMSPGLGQAGVLHEDDDLEVAPVVEQAVDGAGREPHERPGLDRRLRVAVARERGDPAGAGHDEVRLGARGVAVRRAAGQAVGRLGVVHAAGGWRRCRRGRAASQPAPGGRRGPRPPRSIRPSRRRPPRRGPRPTRRRGRRRGGGCGAARRHRRRAARGRGRRR